MRPQRRAEPRVEDVGVLGEPILLELTFDFFASISNTNELELFAMLWSIHDDPSDIMLSAHNRMIEMTFDN